MVFGNRGEASGSGVCFTRDPATGAKGVYGDYLAQAQGEDVVAGTRNTVPLSDLAEIDKVRYDELLGFMTVLETHYRDCCDIEFTIEDGVLWMLQTRVGKRTAQAAFQLAHDMVTEGLITPREALARVTGDQLAFFMFPSFDAAAPRDLLCHGRSERVTPEPRSAAWSSTRRRLSRGRAAGRTSCSSARRPIPTTCPDCSRHEAP